jgi:hypothetical protein
MLLEMLRRERFIRPRINREISDPDDLTIALEIAKIEEYGWAILGIRIWLFLLESSIVLDQHNPELT